MNIDSNTNTNNKFNFLLSIIMNQSLPITTDLAQVFPDIEGELCSRHSILFGKLKNTFGKVYDRTTLFK